MFSEELNQLIEAALEDGVITDKEREILHKRALQEGADPDELDMIIDAKLAKMKKNAQPATDKQGIIKKCPNCGEPVEAGSVKCAACGHVFMGLEANRSSEILAQKLQEVDVKYRNAEGGIGSVFSAIVGLTDQEKADQEKATIIASFPVPTTKEDLLEFLPSMRAKWKNFGFKQTRYNAEKKAYIAKYEECLMKAKALFPNDPDFQRFFEEDSKDSKFAKWLATLPLQVKIIAGIFIFLLLLIGILGICGVLH